MIRKLLLGGVAGVALAFSVAACSAAQTPPEAKPTTDAVIVEPTALSAVTGEPGLPPAAVSTADVAAQTTLPTELEPALTRVDAQGAVEFAVTPLNLAAPGETLDFAVSLNTHSVDLSWDLAAQSALATDSGLEVKGLNWPVGGGHHYEGTLTFPAKTAEGQPLLGGRWAYDVLGWGGYWGWDPVENAMLMPWLTGTAFLHSVMIQEKH